MKNKLKLGIQSKIVIIFSLVTLIILSTIYFYLNKNLSNYTYQRIRKNLLRQTRLVQLILDNRLISGASFQKLDQIADEIGNNLDLRVTIINSSGKVLGDSELDAEKLANLENHLYRPEVQQALKTGLGQSKRYSITVEKELLYLATLFDNQNNQGIVRLSIPLSEIEFITSSLRKLLLFALVISFAFALVLNFLVAIFISKPIKEMSWVANSIARGDFSKKTFRLRTNDEIQDLAKALNYMSDQVKLRIDQVTASKSHLETVLLSMVEGVMVIDSQANILLVNKALCELFYIKEEVVGKKPIEALRNIEIQELAEKILDAKKSLETKEVTILIPEERHLLIHATPILREKKTEGAVLVFHDITDLRKLERVRRDFVANVSHELRTPATSIKGYAETLLEGALEDKANAKEFIKIIHSDSQRLAYLVNDLLDLAKIESGKLHLDLKPCSIKSILKRVLVMLDKKIKEKRLKIKIDIPPKTAKVLADKESISQVFLNLIDNAIKYSLEGGTVTISAFEKNNMAYIQIKDQGIGIEQKNIQRIFERFYRVDKGRSRQLGGTGLGLAIVKHIVVAHKGSVAVESKFNYGSTFTFTLLKAS